MSRFLARRSLAVLIGLVCAAMVASQQGQATAAAARPVAHAHATVGATPSFSSPLLVENDTTNVQAVATGDLNGDGLSDIVSGDRGGTVSVVLSRGHGAFSSATTYNVNGSVQNVAVADLNGDGKPDIVTTDDLTGTSTTGQVAVLLNKGNGTFAAAKFYDTEGQPHGLAVGDVTGDAKPDVVTTDYDTTDISVLAGNGHGALGTAQNYSDGLPSADYDQPQGVALGDFRKDGRLDAVVADGGTGSAGPTYISYLDNDGHGAFGNPVTTQVGSTYQDPGQIITGDFNKDGTLDFGVVLEGCGYGNGDVRIYLGHGNGTFTGGNTIGDACNFGSAVTDVNGDGIPDIVSAVGDSFEDDNAFGRVMIGKGNGTFAPAVNFPTSPASDAAGIAVGNLANGSRPDLVVANNNGHVTALFNESSSGPSFIAGTVRQSGTPVASSDVEACDQTTTAHCTDAAAPTNSAGDFAVRVAAGRYGVTALPPPSSTGLAPNTIGPVVTTQRATVVGMDFNATLPPPGSTLTTAGGNVEQNTTPVVNWGEPSTYTTQGCAHGTGVIGITAVNTATGEPETKFYPLTETPAGSGTYIAHLPALAPLHGVTQARQEIACEDKTNVFPNGGSPAGGTDVLITGSGFTGASAVTFGGIAAKSFTVGSDSAIMAVAPAGTGSVSVVVTRKSGPDGVGSFGYVGVTSLDTTTGPWTGGTTVTIHGTGFTDVKGVVFGLLPAPSFQVVSPTEVVAAAPIGFGHVQVQVVNDDSATAGGPNSAFAYTGGPAGTNSIVEAYGGVMSPPGAAAQVARTAKVTPADDSGDSGGYAAATSQACSNDQIQADEAAGADIGLSQLCQTPGEIINSFGPLGVFENVGLTSAVLGGAFVLVSAGILGVPAVFAVLAIAVVVGLVWALVNIFGFLIDPSGTVMDTHGNPIDGATATLQIYDAGAARFVTLPASSGAIAPPTNPQTTGPTGGFDWDAVTGTYRITASAHGCVSPFNPKSATVSTAAFTLPPPAVGLLLALKCAPRKAPKPTVTAVSPNLGPTTGGNAVDISGTGLAGATSVHFGSHAATSIRVLSPYEIQVVAPKGSSTQDVTVRSPGGRSGSTSASRYAYLHVSAPAGAPTVTRLSPRSGAITGGTKVTITGSHFAEPLTVDVAGVAATEIVRVSASKITALVPPATVAGPAAVIVSTSVGTSVARSAATYTYAPPRPGRTIPAVRHLTVRPTVSRSGKLGATVGWRSPRHAAGTVSCLSKGSTLVRRSKCAEHKAAKRHTSYAGIKPGRTYTVTVFARDVDGDATAAHRTLDGVAIKPTVKRDGAHSTRLTAKFTDTRTRHRIARGSAQLWQSTGAKWRRVENARIRHGVATVAVASAHGRYEWRYTGRANIRMAGVSRIETS